MTFPYSPRRKSPIASNNWLSFGRVTVLQRWAEDLKALHGRTVSQADWRLIGRAVMILSDDYKASRRILDQVAEVADLGVIEIDSNDFMGLVKEDRYPEDFNKALIYIPQGLWSVLPDGYGEEANVIRNFQNHLEDYLSNINPASIQVFCTLGESYNELAWPLRTVGAFDRRFVVAKPSLEELGRQFIQQVGKERCDDSLVDCPGKVGKLLEIEFDDPRRRGLIMIAMQRLAQQESRLLGFKDLVYFATHGSEESDSYPGFSVELAHRVAVHEAGHAMIAIVDSQGRNIPDYTSIIPHHSFRGVVSHSFAYQESLEGRLSYLDMRHDIRVSLAGRAAEELVFGPENVGVWSAHSDLMDATRRSKDLVGRCGISVAQEKPGSSKENLAVIDETGTQSENAHIEALARQFLSRQYESVIEMLRENRSFLDRVTALLIEHRVLEQKQLEEEYREFL